MIRPYNKIILLVSGFDIDPFGLDFNVTACYVMVLTQQHPCAQNSRVTSDHITHH